MYERYIKRCLDVIFAVIALPIVLVVCIIFGALIWLEDRGTIFYLAKRRGKDGTIFNMYKLRSMKVNAPDIRNKDNSTFNSADDPRVTKIGKLMRKISVDELPQVFNILKGDMSWIGPRPVTTDRPLSEYDQKRKDRLKVKPGITGYTQAYYRNNISQEDKLALDAKYAQKVTFLGDLKFFFKTIEKMGVEGKRLLVLGAGRGQIGLYKAAKEMGITTIAGTMPDNNPPGIPLADEVCFMNIANPDEVAKKAAKLKLDGVATCCLDTGISALGKTCDSLGLTGLPEKAAIMCNDKSKMKKAFMEYGVSTAQYFEISSEEELKNALDKIKLPVIIKATDLQGSNGIYIAKTEKDAYDGFHAAMGLTKRSYCIVEEFIEGWEFGAQAFVYNNEVLFVMPHGDETYMSHTAVPVGHYVPLDCDEDVHKQTEIAVKSAIKALGLNNCAVNVDLILRDNKVYVIELTGRVGANCLPELVEINFGIEYYKMIAAMAVGENPLEYWEKKRETTKAGLAKMILETHQGGILDYIKSNNNDSEDVLEITFFKHEGDNIRVFENSNDCIGQVIVQGNNHEECEITLNSILKNIEMKLK